MCDFDTVNDRIYAIGIVQTMFDEMTEDEMIKAGYSKMQIRTMKTYLKITQNLLSGLKNKYLEILKTHYNSMDSETN